MNLKKSLIIAKREVLGNIKRRQFLISIFLGPLLIIGLSILSSFIAKPNNIEVGYFSEYNIEFPKYYIIDNTTIKFIKYSSIEEGKKAVLNNSINLFVYIPKNFLDIGKIDIYSKSKVINPIVRNAIYQIIIENLLKNKVDKKVYNIITNLDFEIYYVSKEKVTKESPIYYIIPMGFMFLIYMSLSAISGLIVGSVVEDKKERIYELLLNFCSSEDIMIGKIFGIAILGLIQLLVWGIFGAIFIFYILMIVNISLTYILLFIIFFILGYLFYTSILLGVASLFSNPKDAGQIITPIIFIQVIPMIFMNYLLLNPNSLLAKILSYIPFIAPQIIIFRVGITDVPIEDIIISMIIMIISIILSFKISAKLFNIGLIIYEEGISLKKIFKILKNINNLINNLKR